jgi:hypothetical protein
MASSKPYVSCLLLLCPGGQTIEDYDPVARRQQCKTGGMKGVDGAAASATKPAAGEEQPHHHVLLLKLASS